MADMVDGTGVVVGGAGVVVGGAEAVVVLGVVARVVVL